MFSDAYDIAKQYTLPVIVSTRKFSGEVECGCAAFILLNDEGWIMTTAHIFRSFTNHIHHKEQMKKYQQMVDEINGNAGLDQKQKRKRLGHLKKFPGWVVNHSFWWGMDGVRIRNSIKLNEGDLVVAQLHPFDKSRFKSYPVFKNPDKMRFATSLCKLGYPFHRVKAAFDEENNRFVIDPSTYPIPLFPIEGIYTRKLLGGMSKDGKYKLSFLETSTPGLRGQSGGPIFDQEGKIWAMQSRTGHHPLGFSPKIVKNGREIEENQFLNVGIGIHGELIVKFLRDNNIRFEMEE